MLRPFPAEEIVEAMKNCKAVAIMDRCESYNGNGGPLGSEITAGLYRTRTYMEAINYTYGLGGRDFTVEDAKDVFAELADVVENGKPAPILKEISSMIREELEPTAARASLPRKFPTTIESTVLYNC